MFDLLLNIKKNKNIFFVLLKIFLHTKKSNITKKKNTAGNFKVKKQCFI